MGNENGKVPYIHKLPSKFDLLQSAINHFSFIQQLNFNPHLFHPKVVQYAIFRYENYWLPFVARHVDKTLVAPIDLELIWVAHILNLQAYQQDCSKLAKQLITHTMVSFERRSSNEITRKLWEGMYADKMPLDIDHVKFPEEIPFYDSIVSLNLAEAVQKYRSFCRQVSLPHYKDAKFLQAAIFKYLQEAISTDKGSRSAFDKEFIWRTHKLTPHAYIIDGNVLTEKYGAKVRQHHSVRNAPKSPDSYDVTATHARGTMPLGDVVPLVSMVDQQKLTALANKTLNFHIMGYRLGNLSQGKNYRLRIRTKSLLTKKETNLQTIRLRGAGGSIVFQTYPEKSEDTTFEYNSAFADVLQIRLCEINMTNSSVPTATPDTCDQFHFDYDFFNCDGYSVGKETKLEFSIPAAKRTTGEDEELSWVRLRCDDIQIGVINLFFGIKKSNLSNADHFCNVLCHPFLMAPSAAKGSKAPCIYVSRALKDRRHETMYKSRVLRTVSGDFFSTEVFDFNEKLICSSYTAGKDVLPTEAQVLEPQSCCVLRQKIETVFIIRSSNFDWGLLKVFHMKTKDLVVPKQILFMNLKDVQLKWVNLYDCEEKTRVIDYKVRGHRLLIDIPIGRLSIPPVISEFPEFLSLGVTVLSLFHCFPYNDTLGTDY